MVTSVHLISASHFAALRDRRHWPSTADGLIHGQAMVLAALSPHTFRPPPVHGHGFIAAWRDEAAFDAALPALPSGGYRALLRPIRTYGSWSRWPELPRSADASGDGPFAVITLGRPKPRRLIPFLRASAGAEAAALGSTAMRFGAALASPSLTVATFSIWDELASMRTFATGGGHGDAMRRNGVKGFHRESAFVRHEIVRQDGELPQLG